MIMSEADDEIPLPCKCCRTSSRGVETSDYAVGALHWDLEEDTVCSFFSVVLEVLKCISILVRGGQHV